MYNRTMFYNKTIVEGEGGMIHSDIFIADAKYQFNNKFTLRGELQYLSTDDDLGDWWYALLELSVLPNWMFTIADEYNSGVTDLHYYQGYVTFNKDHTVYSSAMAVHVQDITAQAVYAVTFRQARV